jgi:hypothetical protein
MEDFDSDIDWREEYTADVTYNEQIAKDLSDTPL